MAMDTIQTAAGKFDTTSFSKLLLPRLYETSVMVNLINFQWGEVGARVVKIRQAGQVTINDYLPNKPITYETVDGYEQELVLDTAKYAAVMVDDIGQANSNIDMMSNLALDIMEQFHIVFDSAVWTAAADFQKIDAANINTLVLDKTNIYDSIIDMTVTATESNFVPEWLVLTPAHLGLLKKDTRFVSNRDDMVNSKFNMRAGFAGNIDGLPIYTSLRAKAGGGTDGYLKAAGARVDGMLMGNSSSITAAIAVNKAETLRLSTSFGDALRALLYFGVKVLNDDGATTSKRLVVHADTA